MNESPEPAAPTESGASTTSSEVQRIRRMAEAGTITRAEADRLIEALGAVDATATDLDAVDADAQRYAAPTAPTPPKATPPTPPDAPAAPQTPPDAPADAAAVDGASGVARWLRIRLLGGDVTIRTREPGVDGTSGGADVELVDGSDGVELARDGDHWILRSSDDESGVVERLIGGMRRRETVVVEVAPGTGVDLDVKAGEVTLDRTPFLRGEMLAGEVSVRRAEGIDLAMRAGELNAGLHLTAGRHRVRMTAGEANLRLLRGSDVRVDARVAMGELNFRGALDGRSRSGLSVHGNALIGDGAAELSVSASAGEVNLRAEAPEPNGETNGETNGGTSSDA